MLPSSCNLNEDSTRRLSARQIRRRLERQRARERNRLGCFECYQLGHERKDCPQLARKKLTLGRSQSKECSHAFHQGYQQQQSGTQGAELQASQGILRKSNAAQFSSTQKKDAFEVEEPEEESGVEHVTQSSCHNNDGTQQGNDDPDEYEDDPSEEEYVFDQSEDEADHNSSSGKKNCKSEKAFNQESVVGCAVVNDKSVPENQEHAGSSGKRRHSRWDMRPEQENEKGELDGNNKKRKTRWSTDDSQLKMPGSLQSLDFTKDLVGFERDPEIQLLQTKLSVINDRLNRSSPPPAYNNLGIRINTPEVRLREKLILERGYIISTLIQKTYIFRALFKPEPEPNPEPEPEPEPEPKPEPKPKRKRKFTKKLYVPVKEYPLYNFFGIILGPRGRTKRRMEKETGTRIYFTRKRFNKASEKPDQSDNEDDVHITVEARSQDSLDAAVAMVEALLNPLDDGTNQHPLEELRKLSGTFDTCSVCREEGHGSIACPQRQSTFQSISCDICGSLVHYTSNCPLKSSPQIGSVPNTQNKPPEDTSDANLYVGHLPYDVDNIRLRELFSPFGKITSAVVIRDLETGSSRKYGFIKFENAFEADLAAKNMSGYQLDDRRLVVMVAGSPSGMGPTLPPKPLPMTQPPMLSGPPGVPYSTAWVGPPQAQVTLPNYGPTSSTTFPVVSNNALSSTGLLAQFPGDPGYHGSVYKQYFEPTTVGPSSPFYFGPGP